MGKSVLSINQNEMSHSLPDPLEAGERELSEDGIRERKNVLSAFCSLKLQT